MKVDCHIPTKILFGAGRLNDLATVKLPGKKALIVISGGTSMHKYGYLRRVQELLAKQGVENVVFDKILPNPILDHVTEGAELARKEGCDFILGLGGGSSIDSSKSIAVMAKNPGNYWDYIGGGSGKGLFPKEGALPIVAITTTAGTGTEADPWTVITNGSEKIGTGWEFTFPVLSIVDPELMTSVPPHLTAYQGFDTLFHCTEGYIANIATPVSDALALKAIELIAKYLPRAVKDGGDMEARENVALANTLGGMVETFSSCTSEHSLEHALSAYYPKLPHGAGLIMISLPYYKFFQGKVAPERYAKMAEAMGEDVHSLPEDKRADAFISALEKLQKACGVDNLKMSDYGVKRDEMDKLATTAKETMGGLFDLDVYRLTHEDTVSILQEAYK
ncbi:iron-containing alcohol dehydrogenase [Candidatus Avelusimicrobium alvi]|uniref:iron-containing alcohol dehydrogenase n=1 Tax=Candidatus Avelusimicrobium alvi TaxID=3416221 RepID=UPI003D0BC873